MIFHIYFQVCIRYKLFKSYCISLCCSQLWVFQSKAMETFCVAWRQSVRRILGILPATHCKHLHYIANDRYIKVKLHIRFVKFIQSAHQSPNLNSNSCFRLVLLWSRSNVSNSISRVCKSFCLTRSNSHACTPVCRNFNDILL